ncbi:unnamed protein product, partial [Closterium sp. Naga37s-1]
MRGDNAKGTLPLLPPLCACRFTSAQEHQQAVIPVPLSRTVPSPHQHHPASYLPSCSSSMKQPRREA